MSLLFRIIVPMVHILTLTSHAQQLEGYGSCVCVCVCVCVLGIAPEHTNSAKTSLIAARTDQEVQVHHKPRPQGS